MIDSRTLTGKVRCRSKTRLFKEPVLVLQVEEEVTHVSENHHGYLLSRNPWTSKHWRDATLEDLQELGKKED